MTEGLAVSGLTAGYGARHVFDRLTIPAIEGGKLVALIGPNAVGKSTLLKALIGIRPIHEGSISLFGEELTALAVSDRARRIGYLPQTLPQATTLVAYELVLSAARAMATGSETREAVEERIDRVFDELDIRELALRRMGEMSGGQRQMVGLAQVLVREPRLLLLDEPTSALDLRWQLRVLETVRTTVSATGALCLLAVHDLNLALRFADRVILLGSGGLLAAGKPTDVLTPDLIEEAYGVSARVESCSLGFPIVLADRAVHRNTEPGSR